MCLYLTPLYKIKASVLEFSECYSNFKRLSRRLLVRVHLITMNSKYLVSNYYVGPIILLFPSIARLLMEKATAAHQINHFWI